MSNNEYVRLSLELHLFFDRIMKEHSFFLEVAFMERENNFKRVARQFQKLYADILSKATNLANGNVSNSILQAGEIVTKDTLKAEAMTSELSGISIDSSITQKELSLSSGEFTISQDLIKYISNLNTQTMQLTKKLIDFKNKILEEVLACRMYTANYPLLINHIMNEAKMYYSLLEKLENRVSLTKQELYEHEIFWNDIMKEHAEFIRGLLDPSEKELILTADKYADEYNSLLRNYRNNPVYLKDASLRETVRFRDFKVAGEEGILNCKIKSVIIPLLADHVVREANHFIRILENSSNN